MQQALQIQHKKKLAGVVGIGFLINNMANYDPTHTTVLRNRFVSEMRKRFRELRGVIRKAIVEQDVLGLARPETYALDIPAQKAFDFRLSSEKIDGFMGWLKTQENKGVLEIIESTQVGGAIKEPWTNKYIQSSYKKGLQRSRAELRKAGYPVPPDMDSVFGGINAIFQGPVHSDAAGILYSRTYNELKGITNAMDQQISRVLSQGIIDGSGPATMAREINNVIKKQGGTLATGYMRAEQRATILARTEVIRAHNEASLQEFANWEVEGVKTLVEHVGAWDSRMCDECKRVAGLDFGNGPGVFTRSQWRNYFPVHPQCRCTPVPVDVTSKRAKRKVVEKQRDLFDVISLGDEDPNLYQSLFSSQQGWMRSLSSGEKQALTYYRDKAGFKKINAALRAGNLSGFKGAGKYIGNLDSCLDRSKLPKGLKIYRGMEISKDKFARLGLKKGAFFKEEGFMSATPSSSIAGNFVTTTKSGNKGILFDLELGDDLKGAYISNAAAEPEVLLNMGVIIRIDSIEELAEGISYVKGILLYE